MTRPSHEPNLHLVELIHALCDARALAEKAREPQVSRIIAAATARAIERLNERKRK